MQLTRRQTALGACTLALSASFCVVPRAAMSATCDAGPGACTAQTLLEDLRALAARLHHATSLDLAELTVRGTAEGTVTVDLGVHLTWLPGQRRIPYSATGPDAGHVLATLRDRVAADLIDLHQPLLRDAAGSPKQVNLRRA